MGETRPDFDEFYQMGLDIREDVGRSKIVICPVDHGAYMDSLFMREPIRAAGVNAVYFQRGPYTLWPKLREKMEDVWSEVVKGQDLSREDCIDQGTTRIYGEYRKILTSAREVAKFFQEVGDAKYFLGFDDWADSGVSALGVYVFGLVNHERFGIPLENVRLAASSDSTGGLAHNAARRSVPRIYPSPEAYMEERRPKTFNYLLERGLIRPDYGEIISPDSFDQTIRRPFAPDVVLLNRLLRTGAEHDS